VARPDSASAKGARGVAAKRLVNFLLIDGTMTTRTLAILLFDEVEVLDFCGPFEVFSSADRFMDPAVALRSALPIPALVHRRNGSKIGVNWRNQLTSSMELF